MALNYALATSARLRHEAVFRNLSKIATTPFNVQFKFKEGVDIQDALSRFHTWCGPSIINKFIIVHFMQRLFRNVRRLLFLLLRPMFPDRDCFENCKKRREASHSVDKHV